MPSRRLVDVSLSTIRAKWDRLPLELHESMQRQVVKDCTAVARAADGVNCDNKIPPEEGRVLAKILLSLKPGGANPSPLSGKRLDAQSAGRSVQRDPDGDLCASQCWKR